MRVLFNVINVHEVFVTILHSIRHFQIELFRYSFKLTYNSVDGVFCHLV
jgi:hypothetical protein